MSLATFTLVNVVINLVAVAAGTAHEKAPAARAGALNV